MKKLINITIIPLFFVLISLVALAATPSTVDSPLNRWICAVAGFMLVLFTVYRVWSARTDR